MAIADYLSGIQRATSGEKQDVKTATEDLSNLQIGGGTLMTKLKDALNTKLNNNKDIINQQADTMQTYFNSGAQAREKYQDVFNPFEKAKLVQQERSMALRPYDVLSGVLENRMGDVNDIVQSGIQGWQGLMDAAGTRLDTAKTSLATSLQSYLAAVGQQEAADALGFQIAQAKEASRQFEKNYGLESRKVDVNESQFAQDLALRQASLGGSGGGLGGGSLNDIYDMFGIIPSGEETPSQSEQSEPQPTNTPKNRAVQYHSPQGQWTYNWNYNAWVPSDAEVID
jgi:hypothetical protein